MASKSEKRRRKRRLVHQGVVPPSEAEEEPGNGAEADPVPEPTAAESTAAAKPAVSKSSGPRRAERNIDDDRPPAPWGSFPLVELAVLIGIVMVILGFFVM